MHSYPSQPAQMPPAPPTWSITKLVRTRTGPTQAGRRAILTKLAYADNGKAARRLDAAMTSGSVGADLRRRLPRALKVAPEVVDAALERTQREVQAYETLLAAWNDHLERCAFQPHVIFQIDIRRRRLPLFVCGITGAAALLRIDLWAGITSWGEDRQLEEVRQRIREYMEGPRGTDLRMYFNEPIGYTYCPVHDEAWDISLAGELVARMPGPAHIGRASFRVAHRDIHALPPSAGPAK